jgi:hypothetical protein
VDQPPFRGGEPDTDDRQRHPQGPGQWRLTMPLRQEQTEQEDDERRDPEQGTGKNQGVPQLVIEGGSQGMRMARRRL